MIEEHKRLLLVGRPNSGKTTLFNKLTGKSRKMANYPGITVDHGVGFIQPSIVRSMQDSSSPVHPQHNELPPIEAVDLPGIYSLHPESEDEELTLKTLQGKNKKLYPFHQVLFVVDAGQLENGLPLYLELREQLPCPLPLVLTKADLLGNLQKQKEHIKKWENDFGAPVFFTSKNHFNPSEFKEQLQKLDWAVKKIEFTPSLANTPSSPIGHHQKAREFIQDLFQVKKSSIQKTYYIDKWTTHPVYGLFIFISLFYFIFHSLYTWSQPIMDFIEESVEVAGEWISPFISHELLRGLLVDGILSGIGSVITFVPQIMVLFFLLSILEQSGYLARAAYFTDRLLSFFGLNGRAFLPYLSGFSCAIPGIMSTKTIANPQERMATLITIPLITCSARLPVYLLLIGTFIPRQKVFGLFNAQALTLFFLYFLGSFVALIMAKIFRLSFFKGGTTSFSMDMPLYQWPSFQQAFKNALNKGMIFLKKAGTIILGLSMLIWILSTFPRPIDQDVIGLSAREIQAYTLENSYLGHIGKLLEPLIAPLGYNWKLAIGLLIAFGARELFVSALGTIYALGDIEEATRPLRERLLTDINPITQLPYYNLAVAWSLLIFFTFACQCISTLGIIKGETNSWKWPIFVFSYSLLLAYLGAFLSYHFVLFIS